MPIPPSGEGHPVIRRAGARPPLHELRERLDRNFEAAWTRLEGLPVRPGHVALVIAARNEAGGIDEALQRAVGALAGRGEILVSLNACTDETEEIVRRRVESGHGQIQLLSRREPGKAGALAAAGAALAARGWLPEFVMQLDADSQVSREALTRLMDAVHDKGYAAVGGRVHYLPPTPGGQVPFVYEMSEVKQGLKGYELPVGAGILSDARSFIAGHVAMEEIFQGEDFLYAALLRSHDLRTTVARDALVETHALPEGPQLRNQQARWVATDAFIADLYGEEELKKLGLGGVLIAESRPERTLLMARLLAHYLAGARTPVELARRVARVAQEGRASAELVQRLVQEAPQHRGGWVPVRDSQDFGGG